MKKIVTVDTVIASLMGAIGYGLGYVIPESLGFHPVLSIVICLIVGGILDTTGDKIIYNSFAQKNKVRRYCVFAGIILVFIAAYYYIDKYFEHSLLSDVGDQLIYVVGLPVLAFLLSLGIRMLKKRRLSQKYGSGEGGFIVDDTVVEKIKDINGVNKKRLEYSGKDPVARTSSGSYIGKADKKGVSFLGITYANAERWKKAVPVKDSEEFFEAYHFGSSEIQPDSSHNVLTEFGQDEDCLNLNIWTSKLTPDSNKPVCVYFHGGDGRYGGSMNPVYHLENIAKAIPDAVFVSINYRFGVFGVIDFSSSDFSDKDEYKDSTAISLLDQIEALRWIKKNISAFGGDPDNITVFGDSAGGSDICLLAATKEAKGLFRRAFIMCASINDTPLNGDAASLLGEKLIEKFHVKSAADLKDITAKQLRAFTTEYYGLVELPPRDGRFVPKDVEQEYLNGAASGIEFIFGIAADDISGWQAMLAGDVSLNAMAETYFENFKDWVGKEKYDSLEKLIHEYEQSYPDELEAKKALLADFQYKVCLLHDCKMLAKGGSRVRTFFWDVEGDVEKLTANGASMVTAILGNMDIAEQMGYLHEKHITEIMQTMIDKYIKGLPLKLFNNEIKGVHEIIWDEYDTEKERVLHIQKDMIQTAEYPLSENVRALERLVF